MRLEKKKKSQKKLIANVSHELWTPTTCTPSRLIWKFKGTPIEKAFYSNSSFRKKIKDIRKIGKLVTSTLNPGRKDY